MKYTAESPADPQTVDNPKRRLFSDEFEKIEDQIIEINCMLDHIVEKIEPILIPNQRGDISADADTKEEYPHSPMSKKLKRVNTLLWEVYQRLNRIENDIDIRIDE